MALHGGSPGAQESSTGCETDSSEARVASTSATADVLAALPRSRPLTQTSSLFL